MAYKIAGTNSQILNKARSFTGDTFKSRIPAFNSANISKSIRLMQSDPLMWNEFINAMLNKVGLQLFHQNQFNNKLKNLKRGNLAYGALIEEFGIGLLDEHPYDPADTNPFEADEPDVRVNWHKVNRRARFDLKINEDLLEEAMVSEGQLGSFLTMLMSKPQDSDEWNEFLSMIELLGIYQREDGFANFQVQDVVNASDKQAAGLDLTEKMRATYLDMKEFYNSQYNPEKLDVISKDLIVITTPKQLAAMDTQVLANAYHKDLASWLADEVVLVKDWPAGLEGTQSLMVDRDFYVCADRKLKTTSQMNGKADCMNYFLHHWSVLGVSRMVNAVRFSTESDSSFVLNTPAKVSSVAIALDSTVANNAVLEAGAEVLLDATVTYDDGNTDADAYFVITGETSAATADDSSDIAVIYPDSGTYVDSYGVLHVGDVSSYDTITVTAVASVDNTKSASITLNKSAGSGGKKAARKSTAKATE